MPRMRSSLVRFEAFLREAEQQSHPWRFNFNLILSLVCVPIVIYLLSEFGFKEKTFAKIFFAVIISLIATIWLFLQLEKIREQGLFIRDPLTATYVEFVRELKGFAFNRTLSERLHPAVAKTLEGSAEVYFRVRNWLNEPSSKNVLGNKMHKDVVTATGKAMREIIFAIHGAYRPLGMHKKQWQNVVDSDPDAFEVCTNIIRLASLLDQLNDIMIKVQSFGITITLTDQLRAVSEAIEEIEQNSLANIKSLPAPKRD